MGLRACYPMSDAEQLCFPRLDLLHGCKCRNILYLLETAISMARRLRRTVHVVTLHHDQDRRSELTHFKQCDTSSGLSVRRS
jgi:hypothetical protein